MKIEVTRSTNARKRRVKRTRRTKDTGNTHEVLSLRSETKDIDANQISKTIYLNRLRRALEDVKSETSIVNRSFRNIGGDSKRSHKAKQEFLKKSKVSKDTVRIFESAKEIRRIVNEVVNDLVIIDIPDNRDNIFEIIAITIVSLSRAIKEGFEMDKIMFKPKEVEGGYKKSSFKIIEGKTGEKKKEEEAKLIKETDRILKERTKLKVVIPHIEKEEQKPIKWVHNSKIFSQTKEELEQLIEKGVYQRNWWNSTMNHINIDKLPEELFTSFPNRKRSIGDRIKNRIQVYEYVRSTK